MIVQIAGIVALDGEAPPEARVEAMLAAMNPRGRPAASRTARHGPALFGALAIAPGGAQAAPPPLLADERGLFVADARLWDAATAGPGGDGMDDFARIAALVRREGGAASARLHGDFAWARWDGRALELARDHFGIRPLYYTVRDGRWAAFASHPGALLEAGLARPALDLPSVANLVADNAPLTGRFYQADIATQRPAHLTRVTLDGRARTRRFWRLPMGPRLSEGTDPAEISAEMRRLLEQAVHRRLPESGPVGGHLSGGLDSSPIAAIAARAIRPEGRRYLAYSLEESSADLDFEPVDEAAYVAEVVAAEPNIDHVPASDPSAFLPYLGAYDGALLEPAGEPEHQFLAHAESAGLGALFSGWGGDQVASFPARCMPAELFLHGRWGMLLTELGRFKARLPVSLYYAVFLPLLPGRWRRRVERLTGRTLPPTDGLPDFRPAALRTTPWPDHDLVPRGRSFLVRRDLAERNWIQHRLARFAHLGAPYGIRYVFPLLDLDLISFAMRVPAYFLARPGASRCLQRDAIRGLVPERVRLREAKLFPHSLDTLRLPKLRDRIDARLAALAPDGLAAAAVDIPALRAAYREALDTPEATLERVREHAARGEQFFLEAFRYTFALQVALALDQYERRHGAEAYPAGMLPGAAARPADAPGSEVAASRA